jgi:hypothetical protein
MFPLLILFIGDLVQVLKDYNLGTVARDEFSDRINDIALYVSRCSPSALPFESASSNTP